jgi:peptide-methionine (S)-S-oxide reductase
MSPKIERATLGGGCFWCLEAIFQDIKGVTSVVSGYSGGVVDNPGYEEVCTGRTGHAEVVQITFDPHVISFEELLYIFWRIHDPTTLNRQGPDLGTQYRSVIFYHSEQQKITAEKSKKETEESKRWPHPLVTEISPFRNFYPAEKYHQNYYRLNPDQPYCEVVIAPKVQKFRKEFHHKQ